MLNYSTHYVLKTRPFLVKNTYKYKAVLVTRRGRHLKTAFPF